MKEWRKKEGKGFLGTYAESCPHICITLATGRRINSKDVMLNAPIVVLEPFVQCTPSPRMSHHNALTRGSM